MIHTFAVPKWHPAKTNELMKVARHWYYASKRKKSDRDLVGWYGREVPKATGKRLVQLHVTLKPRQRQADVDDFFKSCLDALVACGLLVDDSPKWCQLAPTTYSRSAERETAITLTDLGPLQ